MEAKEKIREKLISDILSLELWSRNEELLMDDILDVIEFGAWRYSELCDIDSTEYKIANDIHSISMELMDSIVEINLSNEKAEDFDGFWDSIEKLISLSKMIKGE